MTFFILLSPLLQKLSYDKVENDLVDYLKAYLNEEVFADVRSRVDDLNQESRLCELILEVIYCAEKQMDSHIVMLDDIQEIIGKVREMEPDGTNFRVGLSECFIVFIVLFFVYTGRYRGQVFLAPLRLFLRVAFNAQEDH